MEQFSDELKKVVKAGFGAVSTGVEKAQEVIDNLSKKGEPLYEQAKSAVNDAAEKIKKAVDDSGIGEAFSCRPQVQSIISDLQQLTREELDEVRKALGDIYALRAQENEAPKEDEAASFDEEGNG